MLPATITVGTVRLTRAFVEDLEKALRGLPAGLRFHHALAALEEAAPNASDEAREATARLYCRRVELRELEEAEERARVQAADAATKRRMGRE